jgi:hypothetical protein
MPDKETIYALWSFFILHAIVAITAALFLIIINLLTYKHHLWFALPVLIWAIIIGLHYLLNKMIIRGTFQEFKNKLIKKLNQD